MANPISRLPPIELRPLEPLTLAQIQTMLDRYVTTTIQLRIPDWDPETPLREHPEGCKPERVYDAAFLINETFGQEFKRRGIVIN